MNRCKLCNEQFISKRGSVYCSVKCKNRSQYLAAKERSSPRKCIVCGEEYRAKTSQKTCSAACYRETENWKKLKKQLDESKWGPSNEATD